jgi:KUP system potassium uptake protein
VLSLGALGIVYGDIGTSPLYTIRESLLHVGTSRAHVLGVVSLIVWGLISVIVLKYLTFVLRADNHGEGGTLALLTLARRKGRSVSARKGVLLWFGLAGASLLIGEGTITPAISVLSAVEGLELAAPGIKPFVVPIALVVIVALFTFQRRGTGKIGALFGPAVLVWFASIAAVAAPWIFEQPEVLMAIDPRHGIALLGESVHGFLVLGSVVLCITGGEALYADLGHSPRLVHGRVAFVARELLRPGRVRARPSESPHRQHLLRDRAAAFPVSHGGHCHGCDGGRLAGADFRRLLARAAGHPARLPAAHDSDPHLG